ncbi:MAG: YggT family protein [Polyangiaceae bacterium]|nr:YggT family protein [Myxococcales bacterium]MCB9590037.1 YggT family protein [Polyangiaceae bacterium]
MISFVLLALNIYSWIVLGSALLSWFGLSEDNPLVKISNTLVEPVLAPIRKILPSLGGLDFSPMVLYLGIRLVIRLLAAKAGV